MNKIDDSNELQVLLKNNELIKAKYDLTAVENKLLNLVLYEIQRNPKGLIATIKSCEIKKLTKNKTLHSSKEIKTILNRLADNSISQVNNNGWTYTSIVAGYTYKKNLDEFEIALSPIFLKLLASYKEKGFSSLSLTKYAELSIPTAQRIYELLRVYTVNQYNKKNIKGKINITYSVKELREYLLLENSYDRLYDFKKRVIEPGIKEINKKNLMEITSIVYNKVGKEIESITFEVKDLEPAMYDFNKFKKGKIDSDENIPIIGQIEIEDYKVAVNSDSELLAAKSKLSVKTIDKLIKDNNIKIVNEAVKILVKTENVKAPLKYLKGIIENLLKDKKTKHNKRKSSNFESRDIKEDESLFGWDE